MPTGESQWNCCSPRLAYEMTLEIAKQAPSNGLEPEMMTAIDDHPGFIVAATGLPLPPGHVVREAFSPRSPARVHRLRCPPTRARGDSM